MSSVLSTLLLFLYLAASANRADQLARGGSIDESAPVQSSAEITIDAVPERVWGLLTGINDWPKWQKNISAAKLEGQLQAGSSFTWKTGGTEIHSTLAVIRPVEQLVWTGVAYNAHAIHVWKLQRLSDGRTLVQTNESMNGFLLSLFYSSKQLHESHQDWLTNLKRAAEKPPS